MDKRIIKKIVSVLFIIILLAIGVFFSFKPTITSGFEYSQTDLGDSVLNNFFLEHSFKLVFDPSYRATAWSPSFFYPHANVLTYSDNLWGSAPIYWVLRIFSMPETAFQLWMIIVFVLNFLAFYLLARSLKIMHWLAGVGSFLFAFCLPRTSQLGHQQLLPQFYMALSLFFLFKFIDQKKIKYFICFEVFIYLQMLAGIYLGWFFILNLAILIPVVIFYYKDKSLLKLFINYKTIALSIALGIALIITFFPYYSAQKETGPRPYKEVQSMTPRLSSYFNIDANSIFYNYYPREIREVGQNLPMRHEHYLFIGFSIYLLLIASCIGFICIRKKHKKSFPWPPIFIISLTSFAIITMLSLQLPFTDYSFWINIYNFVPGATAIRALTRIAIVSYTFLFLATITIASVVYQKTSSKALKILLVILSLVVCIEQININPSSFSKLEQQSIQTQINEAISSRSEKYKIDAFYLRWVTSPPHFNEYHLKAMWSSLQLNLPTVNGYSGQQPRRYKHIIYTMSDDEIIYWLKGRPRNILILDSFISNGKFFVTRAHILHTARY